MAKAKAVYNTNDIAKKKAVDPKRAKTAQKWVEGMLGKQFPGDFFDALQDGVVLCDLMNKIKPGSCKKYKPTKVAFVARSNIQIYIQAAKKFGLKGVELFETRDLYDKQALHRVVDSLYSLSGHCANKNIPGQHISKVHQANKRNFTEEQLIASRKKGTVPMWNKGDIQHKTNGQDSYGIIKTDKDMQKHTGAQSVWEQGAKANNIGSNHDSYGIVKNKDLTKHSGGQSVWEQGAINHNTGNNNDNYGIVKGGQHLNKKPANADAAADE